MDDLDMIEDDVNKVIGERDKIENNATEMEEMDDLDLIEGDVNKVIDERNKIEKEQEENDDDFWDDVIENIEVQREKENKRIFVQDTESCFRRDYHNLLIYLENKKGKVVDEDEVISLDVEKLLDQYYELEKKYKDKHDNEVKKLKGDSKLIKGAKNRQRDQMTFEITYQHFKKKHDIELTCAEYEEFLETIDKKFTKS
eukprot:CAMPEP_0168333508 /NCGR_PEP_ID=MMETSP0213-20121227/9649_1 /TAXON_ID=151035 /ORGANISM="Euplotes harpa, Strain FSP1.4" /LENGTH=198 /DNA_ID=CAMNT_0008337845 /DNA_START=27 /DNA_END=624 /DNA_ORIENTATION=+